MSFKSFKWSYCSYCSYFRSDCSHVAVNNGQRVFRSELSRLERKKNGCVILVERKHNGIGYPHR